MNFFRLSRRPEDQKTRRLKKSNLKFSVLVIPLMLTLISFYSSCADEESVEEQDSIGLFTEVSKRQSNKCLDDSGPVCQSAVFSDQISLASYPGCFIQVTMDYVSCPGGGNASSYQFGEFEIIEFICPQFEQDLQTAINNGTVDAFYRDLYVEIWQAITEIFLANESVDQAVVIEYFLGSCSQTCFIREYVGEFVSFRIENVSCTDLCCKRENAYQYDSTHDVWVIGDYTVTPVIETCEPTPNSCPKNTYYTTECRSTCDFLNEW